MALSDEELERYARHIILKEVGGPGQQKLKAAKVLVIGAGGLGSPALMYLAAAGVGTLGVVDDDEVSLSNLQRQIVHGSSDLKRPKVESARDRLLELNPTVTIETVNEKLAQSAIEDLIAGVDVVLDGTDNFDSRFAINKACVAKKKPLVSGAAIRFEGQVSVFRNDQANSPCYQCLYSDAGNLNETCTQTGVVAPLLGIIGSVQALEAIKLLTGIGKDLGGRLLLLDALSMDWHTMRFNKDPKCPICSNVTH